MSAASGRLLALPFLAGCAFFRADLLAPATTPSAPSAIVPDALNEVNDLFIAIGQCDTLYNAAVPEHNKAAQSAFNFDASAAVLGVVSTTAIAGLTLAADKTPDPENGDPDPYGVAAGWVGGISGIAVSGIVGVRYATTLDEQASNARERAAKYAALAAQGRDLVEKRAQALSSGASAADLAAAREEVRQMTVALAFACPG